MVTIEYPHVSRTAGDTARLEKHPRIRVAQIAADHLGNGWSAEEILRQYPHLAAAEVHAALGYFYDHREEIEAELARELAAMEIADKTPATALRLRLRLLAAGRAPQA
jgi:Protein of unknown function (DUF433)